MLALVSVPRSSKSAEGDPGWDRDNPGEFDDVYDNDKVRLAMFLLWGESESPF